MGGDPHLLTVWGHTMAGSDSSRTQQLKTQQAELSKAYTVYDGQQRPIEIYTVHTDAAHNTPCSVVRYAYVNPTSSLVEKMKEANALWDSSWDI